MLSGTVLLKVREKCLYPCVCVCEEPTPSCWYNRPVPWTEYHDPDPLNSHKYPPIISCYNTAGSFKLSINGWSKELQCKVGAMALQSWSFGSAKLELWWLCEARATKLQSQNDGHSKFESQVKSLKLKGQCHEIFDYFFGLKDSKQAQTVSQIFLFSWRYSIVKFENWVSA